MLHLNTIRVFAYHMYMMSYLVILQFLVKEWTHRDKPIIFIDLLCHFQWHLIEQISLHTLL